MITEMIVFICLVSCVPGAMNPITLPILFASQEVDRAKSVCLTLSYGRVLLPSGRILVDFAEHLISDFVG
jgi:hypothetical protein